ncbi:MAG: hypothetical protein GX238_03250 [Epulopiscium sp.]|nr:hypothetical protein [Candidatus Epulonipiscium sp.]
MSLVNEQVAYLKGLVDGLEIDTKTKEGKVLTAIVEVLEDMALVISDLEEFADEWFNVDFNQHEMDSYYCPNCGAPLDLEEEMIEQEHQLICPKCGDPIHIAIDCDCCDHDHS